MSHDDLVKLVYKTIINLYYQDASFTYISEEIVRALEKTIVISQRKDIHE